MIRIQQQLSDDVIQLRYIPFALRDYAKNWLYNMPINPITSWLEFVTVFLNKFYPNHKKAEVKNEINQFYQLGGEPLQKYYDSFEDFLVQYPHHAIYRKVKVILNRLWRIRPHFQNSTWINVPRWFHEKKKKKKLWRCIEFSWRYCRENHAIGKHYWKKSVSVPKSSIRTYDSSTTAESKIFFFFLLGDSELDSKSAT